MVGVLGAETAPLGLFRLADNFCSDSSKQPELKAFSQISILGRLLNSFFYTDKFFSHPPQKEPDTKTAYMIELLRRAREEAWRAEQERCLRQAEEYSRQQQKQQIELASAAKCRDEEAQKLAREARAAEQAAEARKAEARKAEACKTEAQRAAAILAAKTLAEAQQAATEAAAKAATNQQTQARTAQQNTDQEYATKQACLMAEAAKKISEVAGNVIRSFNPAQVVSLPTPIQPVTLTQNLLGQNTQSSTFSFAKQQDSLWKLCAAVNTAVQSLATSPDFTRMIAYEAGENKLNLSYAAQHALVKSADNAVRNFNLIA